MESNSTSLFSLVINTAVCSPAKDVSQPQSSNEDTRWSQGELLHMTHTGPWYGAVESSHPFSYSCNYLLLNSIYKPTRCSLDGFYINKWLANGRRALQDGEIVSFSKRRYIYLVVLFIHLLPLTYSVPDLVCHSQDRTHRSLKRLCDSSQHDKTNSVELI